MGLILIKLPLINGTFITILGELTTVLSPFQGDEEDIKSPKGVEIVLSNEGGHGRYFPTKLPFNLAMPIICGTVV